jgi:hypothetical protein
MDWSQFDGEGPAVDGHISGREHSRSAAAAPPQAVDRTQQGPIHLLVVYSKPRGRDPSAIWARSGLTSASCSPVPPHLSENYIGDYVGYVVDIAQFLPGFLLPVITVLASLHFGLNVATAGVLLALVLIVLIFRVILVLGTDPVTYVSRKYVHQYTLLSAVWLAMNAVAAIWVGFVL